MVAECAGGFSTYGGGCPALKQVSSLTLPEPRAPSGKSGDIYGRPRLNYRVGSCDGSKSKSFFANNGSREAILQDHGIPPPVSSSLFKVKADTLSMVTNLVQPSPPEVPCPRRARSAMSTSYGRCSPQTVDRLPRPGTGRCSSSVGCSKKRLLVPPPDGEDVGKLVVVLDLDETLVYSREGTIVPRPGSQRLFDVLRGRCEVLVWTAGERLYAMEVLRMIDPASCIKHCVYRSKKWWTEGPGCVKDLTSLGRPLDRVILIDNMSECLRANPRNGLLVTDFMGLKQMGAKLDTTLYVIADVIDEVLRSSKVSIESFHAHPQLQRRLIKCSAGGSIEVLTLRQDRCESFRRPQRKPTTAQQWQRLIP
ncbi:TFIIF-stimulated CTD phosphatase, putative [Trypanosoma equiperdum]|uniref:Mitochondrial import inner membrane translocase subunit TIM50 n=3 Tax=Trypanozoon TaxID=39700 RepID=Q57V48_TRYB2|nr:hypothetical protein, conserved [Trypanosoma brucei gambiense DAL972]XP_843931.1 hypothetical protein, conserved [Trypanosoma brucei brucei TREU927]AAX70520.1 hypothetical protein, conserved [Trypanosoma brucei]SCU65595.1 TFIIF-stimulated CTD phosphatase, putative [Trypanosoma equiperdum]AAZ10372.1 hypothetical protein, conserved [Trypanosoma brucei brucei TREU927]CBH10015.1 hypothetical protein, conserved [Trypanosoma brucei gambiense DAL972]|eukprot:XP_011772306.1 hypothetical protein, conserved [Trypanosoma brucei gambiense DAL972]